MNNGNGPMNESMDDHFNKLADEFASSKEKLGAMTASKSMIGSP